MKPVQKVTVVALVGLAFTATAAAKISGDVVKIGVLTDLAGPYADLTGPSSVAAAKMAVDDYLAASRSKLKVEVVAADHQHKPDLGSSIARKWYDEDGVDMIVDVPNSAVGLAVNHVTREKNKVFINTGSGATEMTGQYCSPNSISWLYSTWMQAHGTASALMQQGNDNWFFMTADYAFGKSLEKDAADVVEASGGKVAGKVRIPLGSSDFSSYLLQAQSSKAKVVGLAVGGMDLINAVKQANEFGIVAAGQKLAGLTLFMSDVHSMGLKVAQGMYLTIPFYWDLNDNTRAWAKRFAQANKGKYPGEDQAGVYSGVMNYLRAVEELQDDSDGAAIVRQLKSKPTEDPIFGKGSVRADGRHLHPAYLYQVKTPGESKGTYDYLKLVETIPADKAFRPMSEGRCELVGK